jgi:hypothetical protein
MRPPDPLEQDFETGLKGGVEMLRLEEGAAAARYAR